MHHENTLSLPLSVPSSSAIPRRSTSPTHWSPSPRTHGTWATIRLTPRRILFLLALLSTGLFYSNVGSRIFSITFQPQVVPGLIVSPTITSYPCVEEVPSLPPGPPSTSRTYKLRHRGDAGEVSNSAFSTMWYLLFSGKVEKDRSSAVESLRGSPKLKRPFPMPSLPLRCLDSYISEGGRCHANTSSSKLDVFWTYANETDPLHVHTRSMVETQLHQLSPNNRRLMQKSVRDFGELQFSIRSVLQNFKKYAGSFHVVVSDFEFPLCHGDVRTTDLRLGQMPQWLSASSSNETPQWVDGEVELRLIPHSRLFGEGYSGSTFNSLAIESRFPYLRDHRISDAFIYMNDDIFFANKLKSNDFYTPEHGPIFRMQPNLLVEPKRPKFGEWSSLHHSNDLLNSRFGMRSRPYLTHTAKTLLVPMLDEINLIWANELDTTASHVFRELNPRYPDVATTFLMTHFVVERWREGLLWSWIVGKLGGKDDGWEDELAWRELGGTPKKEKIAVVMGHRATIGNSSEASNNQGDDEQSATEYLFSSQDGFPYTGLGPSGFNQFPSFKLSEGETILPHRATRCFIDYQKCFTNYGKPFTQASEFFKHAAFAEATCGDCIINALVTASGRQGLSAFLPGSTNITVDNDTTPPHLPLTSNWQKTDFSLNTVTNTTDLRSWTIQMLHRYRFVIGSTPTTFARLEYPIGANATFSQLRSNRGTNGPALICINDDVKLRPEVIGKLFRDWMQEEWRVPAQWESNDL